MILETNILRSLRSLIDGASNWPRPSPTSSASHPSAAAAAAAADVSNAFEGQRGLLVHTLQMLQSSLLQTLQSFDELEDGAAASAVAHLDTEMKCLGATYLGEKAFVNWASARHPGFEDVVFQPHRAKKRTEDPVIDVLFATQAGFLCALHADAVLALELKAAGAASLCACDLVISLSEMQHISPADGDKSTVHDRLVLLSDIVERLLFAADNSSGAIYAAFQLLSSLLYIHYFFHSLHHR
jgi:hypothetical protein